MAFETDVMVLQKLGGLDYQKLLQNDLLSVKIGPDRYPNELRTNFIAKVDKEDYYIQFGQVDKDGTLDGLARCIDQYGQIFEGQFNSGRPHGFTRFISSIYDYSIKFYLNGKDHGYVAYIYTDTGDLECE